MLKRSCPRSSTSRVAGKGILSPGCLPPSRCRDKCRHATVRAPRFRQSPAVRSARPGRSRFCAAAYSAVGPACLRGNRRGIRTQPAGTRKPRPRPRSQSGIPALGIRHLLHKMSIRVSQELARVLKIETRIGGLNAEEETVAAGEGESFDVKHRVKGHGEAIQSQHSE